MSFDVSADAYGRFMGRFSVPLAARFADFAEVSTGTALDVGCGTGALTGVLVERLGAGQVCAVDPSASFVAAARARFPDVDVRPGRAEDLPYEDDRFDAVLAQLVVHFMADPVAGLREMARVARPGGTVAAAVWDHAGGSGPLAAFWDAVRDLDAAAPDESGLAGTREGHLEELVTAAGLAPARSDLLRVEVAHASFDAWWEPFTLGVGPAGQYVAGLSAEHRDALRARCRDRVGDGPGTTTACAWAVRATLP